MDRIGPEKHSKITGFRYRFAAVITIYRGLNNERAALEWNRKWKSRELSENGQEKRKRRPLLFPFLRPSENLLCVRVSSTYYSFLDVQASCKSWTVIDWERKKYLKNFSGENSFINRAALMGRKRCTRYTVYILLFVQRIAVKFFERSNRLLSRWREKNNNNNGTNNKKECCEKSRGDDTINSRKIVNVGGFDKPRFN